MELDYQIILSDRKTLAISVERDSSVIVRAPNGTDTRTIDEIVEKNKIWIYQKQQHSQKYHSTASKKEFVNGESVLYLGRNYRLNIVKSTKNDIVLSGKFIVYLSSRSDIRKSFKIWFMHKAKEKIIPRVNYYAIAMGVKFNKISISSMKYRWGSCTPSNNLNFNWRLVKAPMSVVDYVIVHELAHLLEQNHSPRFWNIISTQIPNFLKAKEWLKEHGEVLETEI